MRAALHARDHRTQSVRFIPQAKAHGCVLENLSIKFMSLSVQDLANMHATSDDEHAVSIALAAPPRPKTKATLPAVTERWDPVA
tara:strand:- start:548 stop:799 length:252 start_codon:yes stop_codon:yes gene_type:complete